MAVPLHDWTDQPDWEGVHHLWITELFRWVKPRLPAGYRAYIGTVPTVAIGAPAQHPDVSVRQAGEPQPVGNGAAASPPPAESVKAGPDVEVAVAAIDPGKALYVERRDRLIAAVELVSPRNKDRPASRATYLTRYLGYLLQGIHLLLIDVHRRPLGFSFADEIARELDLTDQLPLPPPMAVSYRVGEPAATGGRLLAIWRRPLAAGSTLPLTELPLDVDVSVTVDLEQTYARAAADMYLS
jgi:hypothetical protein